MSLSKVLCQLPKLSRSTSIIHEPWYLVAAVVMTTLNQPQDLPQLYDHVKQKTTNDDELMEVVLRMKEAIFKSGVILGTPRIINSLTSLHSHLPASLSERLPKQPLRQPVDESTLKRRGQDMFDRIYERHAGRVMSNLVTAYPDLGSHALIDGYGRILSEVSVVNALDTSLVIVAGLMCDNLPSQLKGHYHGALHHGSTADQLGDLQCLVQQLCLHYHRTYCPLPTKTK
ncbi:hypothetical protein DM01DRAFT_1408984 [Hesseltinella vesiculosa]|uniref:Carboxymuconolactone decarboxylase-like domain-containing protein n=1 Tax=Hesseltinella vesiculosa TaxID=101127 RepID=A0A1X2GC69_9FUNG|nr:hypothetical protein DM01DRAFT_1408984 [Hesseltinella vesiculosa]